MTEHDVIAAIELAFADVSYPGDDKVMGGDDGTDIAVDFGGVHWRDVPRDAILTHAQSSNLVFMTAEAFQFYVPAFLIASLDDGEVLGSTAWTLAHLPELRKLAGVRFSDDQRSAIAMFWQYLREHPDRYHPFEYSDRPA